MNQQPIVRVVLGEAAEPHPGPVRWTLDVEGFDVVGQGTSRAELERVLRGVEPTVIVVDDAIPASAVMALRAKAPSAGVVVVWPAGVSSRAIADAHVDPGCIEEDLAHAVRRAARRGTPSVADPPVVVGEPVLLLPDAEPSPSLASTGSAVPRRSARVVLATAAVLALIVMMVGVSFALDATRRRPAPGSAPPTHVPAVSTVPVTSHAGSVTDTVGAAGQDRADCGPAVVPGSKASANAAKAQSGRAGSAATRAHADACAGGSHGGAQPHAHGNATSPHGNATSPHGTHGTGAGGQGTGNGHATTPTPHGNAGSHGSDQSGGRGGSGDQHPDHPDHATGAGSSAGAGRSESSSPHDGAGASHVNGH